MQFNKCIHTPYLHLTRLMTCFVTAMHSKRVGLNEPEKSKTFAKKNCANTCNFSKTCCFKLLQPQPRYKAFFLGSGIGFSEFTYAGEAGDHWNRGSEGWWLVGRLSFLLCWCHWWCTAVQRFAVDKAVILMTSSTGTPAGRGSCVGSIGSFLSFGSFNHFGSFGSFGSFGVTFNR